MRHKLRTFLAIVLAMVGAVVFGVTGPAQAAPVRIMPLGDSITGSPGCWRALLWNRLQSTGYTNIDFVGTLGPQGCGVSYDGDNEGHGGFLATNVANANQLPGWLSATNPDIVLMHFGTNDVWSNIAPATILSAFSTLVDQMRANNPNMKILVAKIIPMAASACAACPQRVIDFNNAIPAWAAGKTTAASPITVVDQWTNFNTTTDTYDGVHPNAAGDQKMSDKWYPSLTPLLSGTPTDTTPPTTPGTPAASSITSTGASLTWTASTDSGGSGLAGYNVYRRVGTTDTLLTQSTTNSVALTGLTASTQYQVFVRARDGAGNLSGNSALTTFTTSAPPVDTTPPTTPGTPTVSGVTSTGATLNWTASTDSGGSGLAGYNVYRRVGTTDTQIATSTTNSVTLTGLTANTQYQVFVRARDGAGNLSGNSSLATFTTTGGGTGGACTATGTVQTQWGDGYVVQPVTVTAGTSAITGWTVTFTLPAGHTITGSWNATLTVSGQTVTAKSLGYNGNLGAGQNTSFGFQASRPNGNTATPSAYTCTSP
ncbi:fibronectin type III domain-containing protein [Acrocarpospora catenulata]|uniref:fibronectin type III domain-containing protein n=1 Tax=Acrocarpospora catenulata TaxID=2836182 RepID=UPI002023AB40|nr:fibronectin type III domain-containing protein [Acrocarpospora catenulata]